MSRPVGYAVAGVLFAAVAFTPDSMVLLLLPLAFVAVLVVAPPVRWAIRAAVVGVVVYGVGRLLGRGVRDGWDRGET